MSDKSEDANIKRSSSLAHIIRDKALFLLVNITYTHGSKIHNH